MKVVEIALETLVLLSDVLSLRLRKDIGFCSQLNRLLFLLLKSLNSPNFRLHLAPLHILINLTSNNDFVKLELARLKGITILINLLSKFSHSSDILSTTFTCLRHIISVKNSVIFFLWLSLHFFCIVSCEIVYLYW